MNLRKQLIFWIASSVILVLLFSKSLGGFLFSFYFVSFLLPVILGTNWVFNYFLVPKYLVQNKRGRFALYFSYLLIVSVYLEMLVMVLAFVILADYRIENLGTIASDIYLLTVILYLIVFANGFIEIMVQFQEKSKSLEEAVKEQVLSKKQFLPIKVDRKNVNVPLNDVTHIESLSDYVKIHTKKDQYITKLRISKLEDALPKKFVRVHRSFIVNTDQISSFNREEIAVAGELLPIGRKYKDRVMNYLKIN